MVVKIPVLMLPCSGHGLSPGRIRAITIISGGVLLAKSSRKYKKPAIIVGAVVAGVLVVGGSALITSEATRARYAPPVSEKVLKYYEENRALRTPGTGTETPPAPLVAFIGDSYSAGAGGTPGLGWTSVLSQTKQWTEKNVALGGTGYVATAGQEGCGLDFCPNYEGVVEEVVLSSPSMVIISGGRNDRWVPAGDVEAKAAELFTTLQARLPEAKIIVTSPIWDDDPAPKDIAEVIAAVQSAAESAQVTYVDLGQPLAGHPEMLSADGVHPNDLGYAEIAKVLGTQLPPD